MRVRPRVFWFVASLFAFLFLGTLGAQERGLSVVARPIVGADLDLGKQYAVLIGIDRYADWPVLKNPVSDTKALKEILARKYFIDEFIELYDKEATAAGIRNVLSTVLPAKLGPHDSLFLYYAGHGFLDDSNTGFWIAQDGTKDVMSQAGWIPNNQIRNYLGKLKAQRVLVVADACFSGDFLNVSRGAAPTIDNAYFKKALALTSRQVLTSGSSETVPDTSEFSSSLRNLLERNSQTILDPVTMFDRIRLGVTKTQPLLGSLPGNESGASFAFFLRPQTGQLSVTAATTADVVVDGQTWGRVDPTAPVLLKDLAPGDHALVLQYSGFKEARTVAVVADQVVPVAFSWKPAVLGAVLFSGFPDDAKIFRGKDLIGNPTQGALEVKDLTPGKTVFTVRFAESGQELPLTVDVSAEKGVTVPYVPASAKFEGFPLNTIVLLQSIKLGLVGDQALRVDNLVPVASKFVARNALWGADLELPIKLVPGENKVVFSGGTIVLSGLPEGVTASVDGVATGRLALKGQPLVLGPYPAGAYALKLTGPTIEAWTGNAAVPQAGKVNPPVVPVKLALPAAQGDAGSSFLGRLTLKKAQDVPVSIGIRAEGSKEEATWYNDNAWPVSLPPGTYEVQAKRAGDSVVPLTQTFKIVSGPNTFEVPALDYSDRYLALYAGDDLLTWVSKKAYHERQYQMAEKAQKDQQFGGWIGVGSGIVLGGSLAGLAYYCGTLAHTYYAGAGGHMDAERFYNEAGNWSKTLQVGVVAGTGVVLTSLLFALNDQHLDQKRADIASSSTKIQTLGGQP